MARKESVTKQDILNSAFEMAATEGIEQVTARKLAAHVGCSTQPIFRLYENMSQLLQDVFFLAIDYYREYYRTFPKQSDIPFVDLGMAYIRFAQENKALFRLLFLSEERYGKSFYEILNGEEQFVLSQINAAASFGCKDPQGMFMNMWIFIHGAASMSLTDDYDLDETQTLSLLVATYKAFQNAQ